MESRNRSKGAWTAAIVIVVAAAGGMLLFGHGGNASATVTCNIVVNSENVNNNSVQTAINSANPGWTICVGAGSFPEQLTIHTAGLTLLGAGSGSTSIDPPTVSSTTVDWDSSSPQTPYDPIILVQNTTSVTIKSLGINGTAAAGTSFTGCGVGFVGVDFQNSSGSLISSKVTGIEYPPALLGCQSQLAVLAYTGWFTTGFVPSPMLTVTVQQNTIASYGKNGITCDDPGMLCNLLGNTVTGIGGTSAIAQNGIQLAYGAVGTIQNNHVFANNYTGPSSTLSWYGTGTQSTGILLYNQGGLTTVAHNTLSQNPMAIVEYETTPTALKILGNTITGFTGYAIVANGAPGSTVFISNNTINAIATGAPGILVDNGTFNVSGNTITHVKFTGTQGASQVVCGTGAFLTCGTSTLSIATAAIQAVSEGAGGPTDVTMRLDKFSADRLTMSSLAMPTGSVTMQLVV
ncbi:MAG: right-handed parallel beta-helix repeat-containing protein [Thermoplasmata archaeon]|nr:right-handed parallel beta-helix repeat-containing protein [Thermoplasmata archaeon]